MVNIAPSVGQHSKHTRRFLIFAKLYEKLRVQGNVGGRRKRQQRQNAKRMEYNLVIDDNTAGRT